MEEDRFLYARDMLSAHWVSDHLLLELDAYVDSSPRIVGLDHQPWREGWLRLFITHVAAERGYAAEVKDALSGWGVDGFVAHEDIEPGAEWLRTILAALHSCDALVAILHGGFKESNWCDQEVGIALGKDVPCVPVRLDLDPYGFLGAFQAVSAGGSTTSNVAKAVSSILVRDKRTANSMIEAVVRRLASAGSWNQANRLARFVSENAVSMTWDHVDRLRAAQKANVEVGGAFDVEPMLTKIEKSLPERPVASNYGYDEEPF